jgi:6-phosphofructokinase 1
VLDRLHTTAASHGRCMVVEIMGNKAGWLTLYSGMAGGADAILLPEIPYDIDKVAKMVEQRAKNNKAFSIVAVAEGAMDEKEAKMKRKEREAQRKEQGFHGIADRIARQLTELVGVEARAVVPGHIQRGGSPCAYDRVLSTQFGVHAADLIKKGKYGVSVALVGNEVTHNKLSDIAGVAKPVPKDHQMVDLARNIGINFGD